MSSILLFDIGNTRITIGAYNGDELIATWHITTRVDGTADEYAVTLRALLRQQHINGIVFDGCALASSVPPLVSTFEELCARHLKLKPLVVGPGVKTGLNIRTDSPREVGADRICNAVAAKKFYGAPAILIDFSIATIFDALAENGDYVGTTIAAGVSTSAEALYRTAAQLPRVELIAPATKSPIGKNTVSALQAGLVYGYVALVEGMIARLKKELGARARVIATGEVAHLIAPETKTIDVVDDALTLKGLKIIWEMNT
ncbi:MAG: type III pantothenate kinase [Chloroflexi bacterium]|nr:type III pantothenate kinase [Chloroflexota bacterium]